MTAHCASWLAHLRQTDLKHHVDTMLDSALAIPVCRPRTGRTHQIRYIQNAAILSRCCSQTLLDAVCVPEWTLHTFSMCSRRSWSFRRVHLQYLGHPIANDAQYGGTYNGPRPPFLTPGTAAASKFQLMVESAPPAKRQRVDDVVATENGQVQSAPLWEFWSCHSYNFCWRSIEYDFHVIHYWVCFL